MPTTPSTENINLPALSSPKKRDYAPQLAAQAKDHHGHHNNIHNDDNDNANDVPSDSDTATNTSDEFDWDEEDDPSAHDQAGAPKSKAKRGRAIWLAFMKLARPIRTLLVGLLGAGVLIAPLLVVQLKFKSNVVRPQVHAWSLWLSIIWAAGCLTYLAVDAIPRLIISIIVLFGGHVERLRTQIELMMAVSGWLKLALDVSWAWISLSVIRTIYKPSGNYWTIVNRVMQALFSAGLILLAEKLFLQFVAINFHRKALADRLAENRLGLKALDRLSNAQLARSPQGAPPFSARRGRKSPSASVDLGAMFTSPKNNGDSPEHDNEKADIGSPVPAPKKVTRSAHAERKRKRRKAMAAIIVDQVGGAIGQVALKNSRFNREGDIGSLYSARRLARKLFSALSDVTPPRAHLIVEDFHPYFRTTAEATAAFALFDKDSNGDISKKEMREAVQRIYRERKSLIASLKDVSSAVAKLDAVLLFIALLGLVFVCLLIFNRQDTLASLVPLATIVLGFSFVFGHSAQTLFESLIFIFSTHVFDVGDLVMIDDQPLLVREFGLFSTTFRRVDGQEIIAPNALLASSKLVHNLRRSSSMWESTTLMISYNTPLEVIERLRARINAYVTQNNREWSGCGVNIDKMEFQNSIHLIIAMEHRPNWQDWGGRWARRTAFMRHLKTVLEELDVKYTMPVQPVLLPHQAPRGSPRLQPAPEGRWGGAGGGDTGSGNAGSFQGSEYMLRAPSRSLRPGGDSF